MLLSMRNFLLSISLFSLSQLCPLPTKAQAIFPDSIGKKVRYSALIEMPKAYISGVCILVRDFTEVKGSVFNEFGISAIDFSYHMKKDKVKIISVMNMIDKWYIRKVLKAGLRTLLHCLQKGETHYNDKKYKLDYTFIPMKEDTTIDTNETEK